MVEKNVLDAREKELQRGLLEVEQKINIGNTQMQELGVARFELIGRLKENAEMKEDAKKNLEAKEASE